MTALQFRRALKHLGLSRVQLATRLAVNVRTVYRWAAGESTVPETVALLLDCWLTRPAAASRPTARSRAR